MIFKNKLISANMVGTLLEIYDMSIYGYFAPIIATNFFPSLNKNIALLNTLVIFLVSFIVRPLGSIIFGHMGDRLGRKKTLIVTISLISFATCGIGLLPNANQIGILAPILLTLLRIMQGLSFSSEYIGSLIFLMEQAPPHKKAYTASWATCGGNIGLLSASLFCWVLTQYCTPQQLYAWGWRVPFLFALLGGGVTLYLRYHITEVFHFQKPANAPAPLLQVLLHQKKSLLLLLCLSCFYMVVCYLIYMWSTTYLTQIAHLSMRNALAINSLALALQILLIPAVAGLSDKIGRKPLLLFGIGSLALGIYPYYLILHTGHLMWITLAHLGISFFAAFFTSILPITIAELIPASSRYSGVGLGYNLAGMLVGGTTPLIGMLLIEMNHGTMLISLYFIFWALLAGVGTLSAFGGHGQKATFAHPTL